MPPTRHFDCHGGSSVTILSGTADRNPGRASSCRPLKTHHWLQPRLWRSTSRAAQLASNSEEKELPPPEELGPWDPEKIRIHTKHYSLRQVVDMITEGDIDIAPDFQRQFVWKSWQHSGLIESLLLGIPLPSFYFSEDSMGQLQVVDGVQRLTTIYQYVREKAFKLGKVTYLHELEGPGL